MTYIYTCPACKTNDEVEQPMADDLPTDKKCPSCGELMFHNIGEEVRSSTIIIPEHMTATETNRAQYTYDKSPSKRKHFW